LHPVAHFVQSRFGCLTGSYRDNGLCPSPFSCAASGGHHRHNGRRQTDATVAETATDGVPHRSTRRSSVIGRNQRTQLNVLPARSRTSRNSSARVPERVTDTINDTHVPSATRYRSKWFESDAPPTKRVLARRPSAARTSTTNVPLPASETHATKALLETRLEAAMVT